MWILVWLDHDNVALNWEVFKTEKAGREAMESDEYGDYKCLLIEGKVVEVAT